MKRIRNFIVALMLAAVMAVPAAQAGGTWNTRSTGIHVQLNFRSGGGWSDRGHRHIDHPAHRFFDGRLYCGGRDGWGHWVSDARCEDAYGRKLVNLPGFVQSVRRADRGHDGWRASRYEGRRNDRYDNRRDDRFAWRNR